MTLQNLGKIIDKYELQLGSTNTEQLELLRGLPFYVWQFHDPEMAHRIITQKKGNDFNHAIGLPQKNGQSCPLFDYEQLVFDTLHTHKHVWIKKATGLGITEFILRYIAWLCLKDNTLRDSQMCIVTGPRIELAITLIDRMKGFFENFSSALRFSTKETVIELNGVHIEAYPSHHLDAMRGLTDVTFIYLDEADFFPPGQQQDARDVSERYIAKSNPWIVMVSTPNAPLYKGVRRFVKSRSNKRAKKQEMLQWTYTLISKRFIKIHPSLQKLILSLRTAVVSDEWKLNKQQTSHNDALDSLRLALCNYELPKTNP